ncbi:MAG: glycosyltransferase [Muribaculaceae bacterium]|nr:glycosyltransferase [Muribaculaceae bacterium]
MPEFNITIFSIIFLSVTLISGVLGILLGMKGIIAVARHSPATQPSGNITADEDSQQGPEDKGDSVPRVSVVVYASVTEETLTDYLSSLLSQDFKDFEVIVVYDATCEAAASLSESFSGNDKIRITFIPPGSHNLSRRKLALTLGIKAARGEYVVTTAANCIIPGPSWLSELTDPFFLDNKDVALGYSHILYTELSGLQKWYKVFDAAITSMSWIGAAFDNKPYRGDGNNLAFRRSLFFSNKGYASNINLHSGEDDIFISEIADSSNTAMVLTPGTILTTFWGPSANRVLSELKEQYEFTSHWLPVTPFLRLGWLSLSCWIEYLSVAAAILCAIPCRCLSFPAASSWLLPAIIGLSLIIILETIKIIIYRTGARHIQAPRLWWSLPIFFLWHPVGNFFFRLSRHRRRYKNYTWHNL